MTDSMELERAPLEGEILPERTREDVWEESVSEWATGASQAIIGQLRQARAAANVTRVHGTGSMQKFAQEVGVSKSTIYDYAKVWWIYGHLIEDGDSSFSRRLESGALNMAQLVAMSRAPDPIARAEEHENESSRQIEAKNHEEKQNEAEEEFGKPEVIQTRICEACGSEVPIDS